MTIIIRVIIITMLLFGCSSGKNEDHQTKLKALIIDGSNTHYVWPKTTQMMKSYLKETGLFDVDIYRLDTIYLGIKYQSARPKSLEDYINEFPIDESKKHIASEPYANTSLEIDFTSYDVIISNLGGEAPNLSEPTKRAFEDYLKNGGGFVAVHATNILWNDWGEFNRMTGLGTWGGRDSTSGPFVYYNNEGKIEKDFSQGVCGSHGMEHEYQVDLRVPDHPITKGLPQGWLHAQDELYDRARGPFENATILATAYSDVEINKQPWDPVLPGSGKNIPVLMVIDYGKGRVFHTTLGHFDYSMECVGFITTFQRGAEWAASGTVTQEVPVDFPENNKSSSREWKAN